jgi:hypothetical protein
MGTAEALNPENYKCETANLSHGGRLMATSDPDSEQLISRFCGALLPADRGAFRHAAESALAAIPCAGEGVAYRTLREVWRGYFHPPADEETNHPVGVRSRRPSKLASAEPIGADDPRCGGGDRNRLRAV